MCVKNYLTICALPARLKLSKILLQSSSELRNDLTPLYYGVTFSVRLKSIV